MQPPLSKGNHHKTTLFSNSHRRKAKVNGGFTKLQTLGTKMEKKNTKLLQLCKKDHLTSVLDAWFQCPRDCKHFFFIQKIWLVPDQEESRSRGTYLLQTPSGSSLRYRSGSPPHWWWCSQCLSLLSGPGRHDRGCASTLPELSFACRTVEIKRSERVLCTGRRKLCLEHDQQALKCLSANLSQLFRISDEQFCIMFNSKHACKLARTYWEYNECNISP